RSGNEPRERRQRARDARAYDRRLPADRQDVDGDRGQERELTTWSRQPHEPAQAVDPGSKEGDVLARDREQVVETRRAEVVLHPPWKPFVLAEDDAEHDASADAGGATADRQLDAGKTGI